MASEAERLRSWLSRGVEEMLVELLENREKPKPSDPFDCDVLVVGSGYGGAVAAARFAGSRRGDAQAVIWLLERGSEYRTGTFPSRFAELPGHVRFGMQDGKAPRGRDEGLFDVRIGKDVSALVGNGLGGGSLINAGVMEEPLDTVFVPEKGWPKDLTYASLQGGYKKVREMLKPQPVPAGWEPPKLRVLRALADDGDEFKRCDVAVHFGPGPAPSHAGVAMQPCTHCGDCVTGCNQGAKGSLDTNYLAWARARGVQLFCGGAVHWLRLDEGGGWSVHWDYTERSLRHPEAPPAIRARHVVLAAGALGSTEILLRSKDKGLALSAQLGKHFSANGDYLMAGVGHATAVHASANEACDAGERGHRGVGPTISGLIQPTKERPFAIEEFAVPAALRSVLGELVGTLDWFTPSPRSVAGSRGHPDSFVVDDDAVEHISLFGLMGDDGADGVLSLPAPPEHHAVEGTVRIDWKNARVLPAIEAMRAWTAQRIERDGTKCVPGGPRQSLLDRLGLPLVTVHPLGGCRMGDGPDDGVVNQWGELLSVDAGTPLHAMAVLDGSIVPSALGINPALTIAALAERAVPKLMERWGFVASQAKPQELPRRPLVQRKPLPAAFTHWQLRERLHGSWFMPDGRAWWVELDLQFEEIRGFRALLAQVAPRGVLLREGTLRWRRSRGRDSPVECSAQVQGAVQLFSPAANPQDSEDSTVTLDYALEVVAAEAACPVHRGDRLRGTKRLFVPDANAPSLWRQLSEIAFEWFAAGAAQPKNLGLWELDLDHLAVQRQAVLNIARQSNMPDALLDLAALGLYFLRRSHLLLKQALVEYSASPTGLAEIGRRWAGDVDGVKAEFGPDTTGGPRLTRYVSKVEPSLPPILLLHGMGMSGSSFTHPAIGTPLVSHLLRERREVWVMDARSSIANEAGRATPAAQRWTAEKLGRDDIPEAIRQIYDSTGGQQIDVFAHCMGAVMFCFAALNDATVAERVRRVVLSQVGPLVTLSPLNRFRGYLASYLREYFRAEEFDTHPEYTLHGGKWSIDSNNRGRHILVDALLALLFPYPDPKEEAERALALTSETWRRVRHRADAIVGQLFELEQLNGPTLEALDALLGWVQVPMLAQAIHFARFEMLMDARGVNSMLSEQGVRERFPFPLLIVHGRLNRVFEWEGSWRSLVTLQRLRGEEQTDKPLARPMRVGDHYFHYGAGSATQLAVFDRYGHLDCLIGKSAHEQVFPVVSEFYADPGVKQDAKEVQPPTEVETPWIGPAIGALQAVDDGVVVRVLLHATPRRAEPCKIVMLPLRDGLAQWNEARMWDWPQPAADSRALQWRVKSAALALQHECVFVTVHSGFPMKAHGQSPISLESGSVGFSHKVVSGAETDQETKLDDGSRDALQAWLDDPGQWPAAAQHCLLRLSPQVLKAACRDGAESQPSVSFAMGSCQYPPGVFDAQPAAASFRRMLDETKPQFLLLLGDQVYMDATAGVFDPVYNAMQNAQDRAAELDRIYALTWRMPEFRQLAARLPLLALLDDHEVRNDWQGPQSDELQQLENKYRLDAYDRHQWKLQSALPGTALGGGTSRNIVRYPAGAPFFLLDTRAKRDPRLADPRQRRRILGKGVMDALKAELVALPKSVLKFIVSPVPLLPAERFAPSEAASRMRSDTWAAFEPCLAELLLHIRDAQVQHVVFLSGDSHLSSVTEFHFNQGKTGRAPNKVVSVVSSGLYIPWPFANQYEDEVLLSGTAQFKSDTGDVCSGAVRKLGLMRAQGYAVVGLQPRSDGPRLTVRLQPAAMATPAPEILVDWLFNPRAEPA